MDAYSNFSNDVKLTYFPSKTCKTFRDYAIEEIHRKEESQISESKERTLLIIGSKSVGKSLLISRFLEKDELPKPTLALEYSYGRKLRKSFIKDLCHIWELGGGTLLSGLLDAPIASVGQDGIENLVVVLMLDLSCPHQLWFTMESLLGAVTNTIRRHIGSDITILQERAWERMGIDHPDKAFLDPFPVPLVILGGKYDLFREFVCEKKQAINRSLRYIAHTLGATLQYYSCKEASLIKRAKDTLSHFGFGTSSTKSMIHDCNKPLLIPSGSDSLQQIGGVDYVRIPPPNKHSGLGGPGAALEYWKNTFTTNFPQFLTLQDTASNNVVPDDPCNNLTYQEPVIDELKKQKDDELKLYRNYAEKRAAIRAELNAEKRK